MVLSPVGTGQLRIVGHLPDGFRAAPGERLPLLPALPSPSFVSSSSPCSFSSTTACAPWRASLTAAFCSSVGSPIPWPSRRALNAALSSVNLSISSLSSCGVFAPPLCACAPPRSPPVGPRASCIALCAAACPARVECVCARADISNFSPNIEASDSLTSSRT